MTDRRWDEPPRPERSEAPTQKLPPLPTSAPRAAAGAREHESSTPAAADPIVGAAGDEPAGAGSARHQVAGPVPPPVPAAGPAASDPDAPPPRTAPGASPRAARRPIKKPSAFPVVAASLGTFFVIVALLAFQMRAGADPAIGKGEPQLVAAAPQAPRQVVVRRVIVTRIVEHRPRRGATPPAQPQTTAPSAPASSGSAAAPAPAAPAPAPAPAPAAPAPAPLETRSS
ncbi:hypothetical protein [Solirubrobacter pauli]|nr:hypothetical protein [Solirubrobacter pauli]